MNSLKAAMPYVRGLARLTGRAIKQRRTRRINQGRRVAGQRVRDRLLQVGVPLPIPAAGVASVAQYSAPVAAATSVQVRNSQAVRIIKTEQTMDINGSVAFHKLTFPICAGDEAAFPSCAALASQYSFFRFLSIGVTYTPLCGTNTAGRLAIGFAPNLSSAEECTSTAAVLGLRAAVSQSIWSGSSTRATAQDLNTQFYAQGFTVVPYAELDYTNQAHYQGILVVATEAMADTALKGKLTLTYNVQLLKSKVNDMGMSLGDYYYSADITGDPSVAAADFNARGHYNRMPWTFSTTGAGAAMHFRITNNMNHAYILHVTNTSTGGDFRSQAIVGTSADVLAIDLTSHYDGVALTGMTHQCVLVTPTASGSYVEVPFNGIAGLTAFEITMSRVQPYLAARAIAMGAAW